MVKINDIEIPTPSGYQVGIMDISKAERNTAGTMLIERIATKRKIELMWNYLALLSIFQLKKPCFRPYFH